MISNLVSLIQKSFQPSTINEVKKATNAENPFASKDNSDFTFGSNVFSNNKNYGKNMPVSGGYFAGYYNDKPNIVGRKLFIEA